MEQDDAIAPVIAVMFILAIGVTFFSVYTATYLPALKQQAEIEHLRDVETGIMRFSSDIDNAILAGTQSGRGGELSEQIRLGGGSILFNPLESSGMIQIREIDSFRLTITTNDTVEHTFDLSVVNVSYLPSNNFWIDQGYCWQYGYTNVTKTARSVPLQGFTSDFIPGRVKNFTDGMVSIRFTPDGNITVDAVSLEAGPDNTTSGNGMARLALKSAVTTEDLPDCISLSYEKCDPDAPFSFPVPKKNETQVFATPVAITLNRAAITLSVD